jgi:GT2 family glycosyltransferase
MSSEVSVLIVSWNTRELLATCLESLQQSNPACVREIIVVDNDSTDGSPEMVEKYFPEIKLIRAGSNLGFAKGNNLAMQHAVGSIFALVNSDALVHSGCIEILAEYLNQHPEVGLVGPRVIGGDGLLQRTCRHLPGLWNTFCRALALDRVFGGQWIFSGYEVPPARHDVLHEAEVLSGCFCLARRNAVEQVGGFDEQFFFYGEDIDWCRRFRDSGWKMVFIPKATATHFGGGSTSRAPIRYSIEILRATLKYWRKHHGVAGQVVCHGLLILHHGLRLFIRSTKRASGFGRSADSRYKLNEDVACLRWLLFGTEANDTQVPTMYSNHSNRS